MRASQAWLVARHDLLLFRQKRSILAALVAFPIGVSVGFPLLIGYLIGRGQLAHAPLPFVGNLIGSFSFWFVIAAASIPVTMASYSIAGEKVERSLEPLLATPTTDGEILLGKSLAAFLPTMAAIWGGSVLFMVLMDRESEGLLGYLYYPNWEMGVILLALTPLVCLLTIEVSILISARAADVRTAQQTSGLLFLPFVLLYVVGEIGVVTLDATSLLYVAAAVGALAVGLFSLSTKTFHREEILTRWK